MGQIKGLNRYIFIPFTNTLIAINIPKHITLCEIKPTWAEVIVEGSANNASDLMFVIIFLPLENG